MSEIRFFMLLAALGIAVPATAQFDAAPIQRLNQSVTSTQRSAVKKISGELQFLAAEAVARNGSPVNCRTVQLAAEAQYGDLFLTDGRDPFVNIIVVGDVDDTAARLAAIEGVRVRAVAPAGSYAMIGATIPAHRLLDAAAVDGVRAVSGSAGSTGSAALSMGAANNQAETALGVTDVRRIFTAIDGTGIRVGTLSDSANRLDALPLRVPPAPGDGVIGIAESQATGDLPPDPRVLVIVDTNGLDEGRAMMEHIFDIAPGVTTLGFATALSTIAQFANNIGVLAGAGMDIINDDFVYFREPIYQDGAIAQAVNDVIDDGVMYFALNHNYGDLSYEAEWADVDSDGLHEFSPGDESYRFTVAANVPPSGSVSVGLNWSEAVGSVATDLQLVLINPATGGVIFATPDANTNGSPTDLLAVWNTGGAPSALDLRIRHVGGPAPTGLTVKIIWYDNGLGKITLNQVADGNAKGTLTPHAGTQKSIAIGAAPFFNTGVAENFSGRGPHRRFFDTNGVASVATLTKPDFLSIDACNTTFFCGTPPNCAGADIAQDADAHPNFFGTSAATPNAAAVAALMLQAAGGPGKLDQEGVRRLMRLTAIDLGTAGHDTVYGHGRIHALGAVSAASGPGASPTSLYPNFLGDIDWTDRLASDAARDTHQFVVHDDAGSPQTVPVTLDVELIGTSGIVLLTQVFDPGIPDANDRVLVAVRDGDTNGTVEASFSAARQKLYATAVLGDAAFTGHADYRITLNGPTISTPTTIPITNGAGSRASSLGADEDLAVFEFEVPENPKDSAYDLIVTLDPDGFDGIILLNDSKGAEIARGDADGAGSDDILFHENIDAGEALWLVVASSDYAGGSGDFRVDVEFFDREGLGACCRPPEGICEQRTGPICGLDGGLFGGAEVICAGDEAPVPLIVDPFVGPCLLWGVDPNVYLDGFDAMFDGGRYVVSDVNPVMGAVERPAVRLFRSIAAPDDFEAQIAFDWNASGAGNLQVTALQLGDAGENVLAEVGLQDLSVTEGPHAYARLGTGSAVTGADLPTSGAGIARFEVVACPGGANWRVSAFVEEELLLAEWVNQQPARLSLIVEASNDAQVPFGQIAFDQLTYGAFPPAPGDTDGDADVDLVDWQRISECIAGPDVLSPSSGCTDAMYRQVDVDCDGDADLVDLAAMQAHVTPP